MVLPTIGTAVVTAHTVLSVATISVGGVRRVPNIIVSMKRMVGIVVTFVVNRRKGNNEG